MSRDPLFTVLLPVHRPPALLPFAIDSVLGQSLDDFALFVICDGTPRETVDCARAYAARDPRVQVFAFEKGERHGEAHRHTALGHATSRFVAQIGDDDLWFPNHLAELAQLLDRVDFGNLLQAELAANGSVVTHVGDLAEGQTRRRMCESLWNFFGPSCAGYRLSAYRRLPVGWSPAPPDVWTDLYMWRKFLVRWDIAFGTRFAIQGVKLSAGPRADMPLEAREQEHRAVAAQFARREERSNFQARAFHALFQALHQARREAQVATPAASDGENGN
jgi:glycosyltransferase involved in cell wall biosynthesis